MSLINRIPGFSESQSDTGLENSVIHYLLGEVYEAADGAVPQAAETSFPGVTTELPQTNVIQGNFPRHNVAESAVAASEHVAEVIHMGERRKIVANGALAATAHAGQEENENLLDIRGRIAMEFGGEPPQTGQEYRRAA